MKKVDFFFKSRMKNNEGTVKKNEVISLSLSPSPPPPHYQLVSSKKRKRKRKKKEDKLMSDASERWNEERRENFLKFTMWQISKSKNL